MRIKMIGIDFNEASLKERELFAFSASQLTQALKNIYSNSQVSGCVILSTCNRTELWLSEAKEYNNNLIDIICREKGVEKKQFEKLFIKRGDHIAILHLFETACGMRSQILGEDQILTQVKTAIETARENNTTDELLEKLFQCAVTSAKKIKSEVRITTADTSVAHAALVRAKDYYGDLKDIKCLVIGNGEMGRLAAELFIKNGADVSITLRNHKNGKNIIPEGCKTVDYEKRIEKIREYDIIISATLSPHHTVQKGDVDFISTMKKKFLLFDLAVPRDIDERIREFENVVLVDMDNIGIKLTIDQDALQKANAIIDEYKEDFYKWYILRKYLPTISLVTFENMAAKLKKEIDGLDLKTAERSSLEDKILTVLKKAI